MRHSARGAVENHRENVLGEDNTKDEASRDDRRPHYNDHRHAYNPTPDRSQPRVPSTFESRRHPTAEDEYGDHRLPSPHNPSALFPRSNSPHEQL